MLVKFQATKEKINLLPFRILFQISTDHLSSIKTLVALSTQEVTIALYVK